MAHRSSSPALHAARTILKNYDLRVKSRDEVAGSVSYIPTLKANEAHLSVLIDGTTNVDKVANLRPEWKYWVEKLHLGLPDAAQILQFVKKIVEEFAKVPQGKYVEEIESVQAAGMMLKDARGKAALQIPDTKLAISAYSKQAVTYICAFYHVIPRGGKTFGSEWAMQLDMAKLIELSLGLRKAMPCLELARKCQKELKADQLTLSQVKAYFRQFGVLMEYLPNYEKHEEETKLLV